MFSVAVSVPSSNALETIYRILQSTGAVVAKPSPYRAYASVTSSLPSQADHKAWHFEGSGTTESRDLPRKYETASRCRSAVIKLDSPVDRRRRKTTPPLAAVDGGKSLK